MRSMMRHIKPILGFGLLFLTACSAETTEVDDMNTIRHFVSETKNKVNNRIEPLPEILPVRPLGKLTRNSFSDEPVKIIDDWRKQDITIPDKGRGQR